MPPMSLRRPCVRATIIVEVFLVFIFSQFATAVSQVPFGLDGLNGSNQIVEAPHTRRVFYLGGQYEETNGAMNMVGQVYTEQLLPVGGAKRPNPLIFFHCGSLSGAQWLQTPDNREGWASYFLREGYAVYLIDISSTARSSRLPNEPVTPPFSVRTVQSAFTAPEKATPPLYPQAILHSQWPGTGLRGDPIFDTFYPSAVSTPIQYNVTETAVSVAICQLLDHIGPSFLIAHAYGAFFPWPIADRCSSSVQGIFSMESDPSPFRAIDGSPGHPYGLTDVNLSFDPPVASASDLKQKTVGVSSPSFTSCQLQQEPARKLPRLSKIPILQILAEAGPHASTGHCQPEFLRQAGVPVSLVYLADVGIHGNGQLLHMEKNNLDIAKFVSGWLRSREGPEGRRNLTDISSTYGTVSALGLRLGLSNGTGIANGTDIPLNATNHGLRTRAIDTSR